MLQIFIYRFKKKKKNGVIATSAIDHVYCNSGMSSKITISKSNSCSSDHLPVMASRKNVDDTIVFTMFIITDTIQARSITDKLFPSNLEVHFTGALSWPARNTSTDVYLQ